VVVGAGLGPGPGDGPQAATAIVPAMIAARVTRARAVTAGRGVDRAPPQKGQQGSRVKA
jgi:hypothetical protein